MLYQSLKEHGIRFYMTEHIASLNEQLRKLGLGYMIEEGSVRRTIHIALKDMGITRPYPLEGGVDNEQRSASRKRADNRVQEFVWAFGSESEEQIEKQIVRQIEQLKRQGMWKTCCMASGHIWKNWTRTNGWSIWKNISRRSSIYPVRMRKRWQSISKHTEKKCMTVLPGNILNWQNASRSAGIYWMNT